MAEFLKAQELEKKQHLHNKLETKCLINQHNNKVPNKKMSTNHRNNGFSKPIQMRHTRTLRW